MALRVRFENPAVWTFLAVLLAMVVFTTPTTQAQFPDIVVTIGDTTGAANDTNTVISIFLDNFFDTLAGFNLWITLDNPDILRFQINSATVVDTSYWFCDNWGVDSICVESTLTIPFANWDFVHIDTNEVQVGNHDATGTLIADWQYVDTRSLSGFGTDINIAAFANKPEPPETPGIAPQQGGLLIKILADVLDVPDTALIRTVNLLIQHETLDHLNFSRNDGTSIGIIYEPFIDTTCWVCTQWCGPVCCNYQKVSLIPPGGCDSMLIQPDSAAVADTTKLILIDGSLSVPTWMCGDTNGDNGPVVDISDLMYLVAYIFLGGPAPNPLARADINCSGGGTPVDVADLTGLVAYIFTGGAAPCSTCP